MAALEPLPSRRDVIARARAAGKRIAAVLPIHQPRALLTAHGFHSVEIWGPPGVDPTLGSSHFQSYTCGIVRNATAFLLSGKLDDADAILVPHTCDALQGMGSVLKDFIHPKTPVLTLYLPRDRRDSDYRYLVDELKRLGAALAAISGRTPSDAELHAAIAKEAEADASQLALQKDRENVALDDRAFYALLRSREYLDVETFLDLARSAPRGPSPSKGVKLMLSGIVPEPMTLFDALGEVGARVVGDDLACLNRRIYVRGDGKAEAEKDPYVRLVRTMLGAPPDPTLGTPIPERVSHVKDRMKALGARGLLVYDPKFCEPELFYLPLLKKGLDEAGLPMLHLEFDMSESLPAQTRTRIEAFVEMLR